MTDRKDPWQRVLSAEERALWERIARTATPLGRTPSVGEPADEDDGAADATGRSGPAASGGGSGRPEPAKPDPVRSDPIPKPAAVKRTDDPPTKLDRRTERHLRRGQKDIDGRLDLHGLTQAAALPALRRFLASAQQRGWAHVLVITGKGREADDKAPWGEDRVGRGILKRQVPLWLAAPDLRSFVVGVSPAHRRHGGEGALYVRIRKAGKVPK